MRNCEDCPLVSFLYTASTYIKTHFAIRHPTMEPRARAGRHKANLNFNTSDELSSLLLAAGAPTHPDLIAASRHPDSQQYLSTLPTPNKDSTPTPFTQPYPETLRVLDEILTDFIIETCHSAVGVASYSGRTKLKLADFEWVLRRDAMKLGRVQEMFRKKREVDSYRKVVTEGADARMGVNELMELGDAVGEEGTGKGKGRGRGRRKKRNVDEMDGEEGGGKKSGNAKSRSMVGSEDGDFDDELDEVEERASKKAKSEIG